MNNCTFQAALLYISASLSRSWKSNMSACLFYGCWNKDLPTKMNMRSSSMCLTVLLLLSSFLCYFFLSYRSVSSASSGHISWLHVSSCISHLMSLALDFWMPKHPYFQRLQVGHASPIGSSQNGPIVKKTKKQNLLYSLNSALNKSDNIL